MSTAVVTGATEGIGLALAEQLAARGNALALCARNSGKITTLAGRLESGGARVLGMGCDVSRRDEVTAFAARTLGELGTPTLLINNAGIALWGTVAEMAPEDWDSVIAINVTGMFNVTRAFLPAMLAAGRGTIVNVSSLAGRNGTSGGAAYSASKHAVLGFSRSLMLEVRSQGVRVIAVCPGSVDTPLFEKTVPPFAINPERMMRPGDVARAILDAVALPDSVMVSELDIRPTNP